MNITVIKYTTADAEYSNLVIHQCSFAEFLRDIRREIGEFAQDKEVNKIDIFWHLDEYCDKKYGRCQWEIVTIASLMLGSSLAER